MCGVSEGALPPGPNALIPQWEGASPPIVEQTPDRDLSRGTERDDDPDENKDAEARDTARVVIFDAPIGSATDTPTMDDTDEQQWKQRLHTECAKLRRENNVDINPAKLCAISKQLYGSQVKPVLREADNEAAVNIILRDVIARATKSIQGAQHVRYIPSPTNHTTLEFNGRRIDSSGSTQQLYADPSIFPKTLTPNMNSAAQQQTESQIAEPRIPPHRCKFNSKRQSSTLNSIQKDKKGPRFPRQIAPTRKWTHSSCISLSRESLLHTPVHPRIPAALIAAVG